MRVAPFLLAALAMAAVLASLPPASAEPLCLTADQCVDPPAKPHCPPATFGNPDGYGDYAILRPDCTVYMETGRDTVCVGAWYATDEHKVGPVHWTRHYCTGPNPPPVCCATDGASADPVGPCTCPPPTELCKPVAAAVADRDDAVDYTLSPECEVQAVVDLTKAVTCNGEVYVLTRGPLTVLVPTCMGPCTCDPEPVPLAPEPLYDPCDLEAATPAGPLRTLTWGNDAGCDVDVEPIGGCAPPSGRTYERDIAFVHLVLLVCGGGIDPIPDWS
jgi:hypothetical protein